MIMKKSITLQCLIDYKTGEVYGLDKDKLKEFVKEIQASAVNVQITKR